MQTEKSATCKVLLIALFASFVRHSTETTQQQEEKNTTRIAKHGPHRRSIPQSLVSPANSDQFRNRFAAIQDLDGPIANGGLVFQRGRNA